VPGRLLFEDTVEVRINSQREALMRSMDVRHPARGEDEHVSDIEDADEEEEVCMNLEGPAYLPRSQELSAAAIRSLVCPAQRASSASASGASSGGVRRPGDGGGEPSAARQRLL
jgi:transposase